MPQETAKRAIDQLLQNEQQFVRWLEMHNFMHYVEIGKVRLGLRKVLYTLINRKPTTAELRMADSYWYKHKARLCLQLQDLADAAREPIPQACADNAESTSINHQQETIDDGNNELISQVAGEDIKQPLKKESNEDINSTPQVVAKRRRKSPKKENGNNEDMNSTPQVVAKRRKKSPKTKNGNNEDINSTSQVVVESTNHQLEKGDNDDVSTPIWFMVLCSAVDNLNCSYPKQNIDDGYVQETCLKPFRVITFDEERLRIAIDKLKMKAETTLHVGTSLNVVKKLPNSRDVCVSVAFFNGEDSSHQSLILSDMLSEKRDTATYQRWLTLLDDALEKVSSGTSIKRTESNYNMELLSALTMAFNRMSLPLYLKICYNALTEDEEENSQKGPLANNDLNEFLKCALHICSFHTMYLFNKFLSQLKIPQETKKFYMFATSCVLTSRSYKTTKEIFEHICTITLNEKYTPKVQESILYFFESFFQDRDEMDTLIKRVQACEHPMEEVDDQPGYSQFASDFMAIAQKVSSEISSSENDATNTKYCPDFLTYFIQYWSPIIPLWTANILSIVVTESHVTNESAKDLFSTIKNGCMEGERRWSYDKFLTTMSAKYKIMNRNYIENHQLTNNYKRVPALAIPGSK